MDEYKKYFLLPGYIFYSQDKYIIETILGSCVSVCIFDRKLKIGGMNHYIYNEGDKHEASAKFGNYSINYLLQISKEHGSKTSDIDAYVIGGARNEKLTIPIGAMNIEIAKKLLKENGIEIKYEEVGGLKGRKVEFNNYTGEINVKIINLNS